MTGQGITHISAEGLLLTPFKQVPLCCLLVRSHIQLNFFHVGHLASQPSKLNASLMGTYDFFFARASRWLGPNTQTPRLAEVGVVQKGIGACYTIQSTMQELLTSFLRFAGAVAAEVLGVLCRICTDEATDEVTGATR